MTRASYVGKRTVGASVDSFFAYISRGSHPLFYGERRYSYSVQVKADVLTTVYFQTSKRAVMIRLSILDQEREVTSRTGQGHVSIPAFFFLTNNGEHPSALITEMIHQ